MGRVPLKSILIVPKEVLFVVAFFEARWSADAKHTAEHRRRRHAYLCRSLVSSMAPSSLTVMPLK